MCVSVIVTILKSQVQQQGSGSDMINLAAQLQRHEAGNAEV